MDHHITLKELQPEHDFFIGIDSDGCVFDSMEVKQKEFFIPLALKYFDLFRISKALRETWEFVNLYSAHRGGNRFQSLIKVFELLAADERVKKTGQSLPDTKTLKKWAEQESKLGNDNLRRYYELNPDPGLEKILKWSEAVNEEISRWLRNVPPFPNALEAIRKIPLSADLIIVSQTPLEALEREWSEHDLKKYVKAIAGLEHGTKSEHLESAAKGKYPDDRILMIGDAKGDLDAAIKNKILFFPIIPGKEDESWKQFLGKGFEKFLKGTFYGKYQKALIDDFRKYLPETPALK